jgi:hypothetical protein
MRSPKACRDAHHAEVVECALLPRLNIPGDLIETGIWRGGAVIFMRGVLAACGIADRIVWAADSFEGVPPPTHPQDANLDLSARVYSFLVVSLEQVSELCARYDLLDGQVKFLKGWFKDTLQTAPIEKLAMLRLDGDLYESTPAKVYDRAYQIGVSKHHGSIFGSLGDVYRIVQDRIQGYVDFIRIDTEAIQFIGWAVEADRRLPAQIIAVFIGDRFLGYGSSCTPRPDVAKDLGAPSAQYAGFDLLFPTGATNSIVEECRLFVLSQDGCAAELQRSFSRLDLRLHNAVRAL